MESHRSNYSRWSLQCCECGRLQQTSTPALTQFTVEQLNFYDELPLDGCIYSFCTSVQPTLSQKSPLLSVDSSFIQRLPMMPCKREFCSLRFWKISRISSSFSCLCTPADRRLSDGRCCSSTGRSFLRPNCDPPANDFPSEAEFGQGRQETFS